MVCLYWLQDRDSMPNWNIINHPTTLHTHNETQWPSAAHRWYFGLRYVSCRQSCHPVPLVWPYCWQAQCRRCSLCSEVTSITKISNPSEVVIHYYVIADLLTSSHPQKKASNLLGLQGLKQTTALLYSILQNQGKTAVLPILRVYPAYLSYPLQRPCNLSYLGNKDFILTWAL